MMRSVEKSTFTPLYKVLKEKLISMRKSARLTQRQLADKLAREQSFIGRIELGERRLDIVEFYWVCHACNTNPEHIIMEILREFKAIDKKSKK